ncbi:MAG: hypothetical protein J5J00_09235 [Deltaproteobacteria bacterium]|nr:hypothetical protein [Deltaproteobacteria bacterium]
MQKKLPAWGYVLLLGLAALSTFGLQYLNPILFPVDCTLPALIVYFSVFLFIVRRGMPILNRKFPRLVDPTKSSSELIVILIMICMGMVAGILAGLTWWAAGGSDVRTLSQALLLGGMLGAIAVVALAGGG